MKVNVPAKVIPGLVNSASMTAFWDFDDGEGDPFWRNGTSPKPYRWELDITIDSQSHSSHLTRVANTYNGIDVAVGMWVAETSGGLALKIISIESKTDTSIICEVEDVLRYNTFRATGGSGSGIFSTPANVIIFEVNEDGEPVIDPLPAGGVGINFYTNIDSRFKAFSLQDNFLLEQESHGFALGDPISIDPISGSFELVDINSFDRIIGTVSAPGPGPDFFLLDPTTKIVENFDPSLPGSAGDFIFADPDSPGEYTTTDTGRPIFLKLTEAIPTVIRGTIANATTSPGNELIINGVTVTFTTGTGTIDDAVMDINALTASHGITASKTFTKTTVISNSGDLVYGQVGAFTDSPGPASATINGMLVTFADDTDGQFQFALNVAITSDMVRTINDAEITDIEAEDDGGLLRLTNIEGGVIDIVNVDDDENGNPWAGSSPDSCTGLILTTPASTDEVLKLVREDGGEIILQNGSGDPIGDFGIFSAHNGRLPIGLVVEQGIRKGDMYIVADIPARDALTVLTGDQAFVLDKGDGEWGMFIVESSGPTEWTQVATFESARVDSRSIQVDLTPSSISPLDIGEVNGGVRVTYVTVDVTIPFNGTNPTLEVGDTGVSDRLMTPSDVDLTIVGTYATTPAFRYADSADNFIRAAFDLDGSTSGFAKITITYS